ncbi:MAG: iron hydrogenase, partial [Bacteroidales bacterium]|nr:iron hydrogenase [Bacteroidales bacterium]
GLRSTDIAITTNELAIMLKSRNVELSARKEPFDQFMGTASGAGKLFGNTGGVMSAAIRTAHFNMTGKNPAADLVELKQIHGLEGLKTATVNIGGKALKVAVCYEMRNAQILLDQVASGSCEYDFIEVMSCKGGCIGGAGQPTSDINNLEARIKALSTADSQAATRFCHENPEIISIYKDFIGKPGGTISEQYLHTHFTDKSSLLEPILAQMQLEPAV